MRWLVLLVEPGVWPSLSSQVSFRLPHRGCRGASLQGPPNLPHHHHGTEAFYTPRARLRCRPGLRTPTAWFHTQSPCLSLGSPAAP